MNIKSCILCSEKFSRPYKYSKKQWEEAKFCSLSCRAKFFALERIKNPKYLEFLRNLALGRKQTEETKIKRGIYKKGEESYNWKGGINLDKSNGYLRNNLNKKRVHRIIMEEFLGRQLYKEEQIHHINGNKLDNRIENLMLVSNSEHRKYHNQYKCRHGIRGINNLNKI